MILQLKLNIAWFLLQSFDTLDFRRYADTFVSWPYSEPFFSVNGRLVSSINVPHKSFMLFEEESIKSTFTLSTE